MIRVTSYSKREIGDTGGSQMLGCKLCNVSLGYSCSGQPSVCTASCGSSTRETNEECDDGNSLI